MEIAKKKNFFSTLSNMDMTKGNLFLKLILFALPFALASMMQLLYTTIDLVSVRFGDSPDSAAAISANGALINLIIVLFNNIALGANVTLASAKGANEKDKAQKTLHTATLFAAIAGIGVAIIGFFVAPQLLILMDTEPHLIEKASAYLRVYFLGMPFVMLFNYLSQMLRASGDSQSPFLILFIAGLTNVAFDSLFVFVFHLGVIGVAVATIIAQALSCVLAILVFKFKRDSYVRFRFKELRIDGQILKEILRIGIPAGLQGFFFSLPNVFIQAKLYTIDPGNVALENGAIAASNIESYLFAGIDAISMAVMSFTAANFGAKLGKNIKKVYGFGLIWGFIYYLFCLIIVLSLSSQLLLLFVEEEASIEAGQQRLFIMASMYFLNAVMGITAGVLRGVKHSAIPMWSTLIWCTAFRIIYLLTLFDYVPFFHTLAWLYALFPITWGLSALSNLFAFFMIVPKECKKLDQERESSLQLEA